MKAYNQAKDQIVIEDINSAGREATFFSYGKKVATINTVSDFTFNGQVIPVRDVIGYDPAVAFFSKTTAKHFKKFIEDKAARSDIWYFIKQNEKVGDASKNPDYGFMSIESKSF